jgi:hypothetical protein
MIQASEGLDRGAADRQLQGGSADGGGEAIGDGRVPELRGGLSEALDERRGDGGLALLG